MAIECEAEISQFVVNPILLPLSGGSDWQRGGGHKPDGRKVLTSKGTLRITDWQKDRRAEKQTN